jgi:putative inorganic carbon (HCO3(-)) transporter
MAMIFASWHRLDAREALGTALFLALAAALGALAVSSLQLGASAILLLGVCAAYTLSKRAGLVSLWMLWLFVPAIRRVLALMGHVPVHDPLSVIPFLATIIVAFMELPQAKLDLRARRVLLLAACGFAFGIPLGLRNPTAFLYDALAYAAALSGLVIGYAEVRAHGEPQAVSRLLLFLVPLIALYGIYQYFNLLPWDQHWFETAELTSIGGPQKGHPRIWGTLNSPGIFAPVLGLSLVASFSIARERAERLVLIPPLVVALALTYVRTAWIALVVALIMMSMALRGKGALRVMVLVSIVVGVAIAISTVSPVGQAVVGRATSFGSLGKDQSANARVNTPAHLLPSALRSPFGSGLGSAGLASGLSESSAGLKSTDNGYLSLIVQLGPIGALCVLSAMIWVTVSAAGSLRATTDPRRRVWLTGTFAMLVFLLVYQLGGEVLYGVTGVLFWYLAGCGLAQDVSPVVQTEKPQPLRIGALGTGLRPNGIPPPLAGRNIPAQRS